MKRNIIALGLLRMMACVPFILFLGRQVLANPEEADILLLRNYWSGLKGPEYWVFVRFQDEKSETSEPLS